MKRSNLFSSYALFLCFFLNIGAPFQTFSQIDFSFNFSWEQNVFPNNPYTVGYDVLDRPYFYVANDDGGVRVFKNETDTNPIQIDQITIDNWDNLSVMHLTQQGHFLYLALGSFFDNNSDRFGIAIINIENPETGFVSDFWISENTSKGSAEIKVRGDYAFLGAMNAGLYILNISNPNDIQKTADYLPNIDFPIENPNSVQEPNARGMVIKDDLLYLCYDAGGLSVIDISDINAPHEISRYINTDILGITQQAYNYLIIHDDKAYVAVDYCGLEILDISNPLDISLIETWNPWGCETPENTWQNSLGHTNQLHFLPGHEGEILLFNANDVELVAMDISDPTDLKVLDILGETGDSKRTWGFGISETQIAVAYYFTLFPWQSSEAKVKTYTWDFISATNEIIEPLFNISPNPVTSNLLQINFEHQANTKTKITVTDLVGKIVFQQQLENTPTTINLDLATITNSGMYLVRAEKENKIATKKIIFIK